MLTRLKVQNFAIIDSAEINFKQGLNIFTGETGAGKSIIIEALNFVLGSRADATLIKEGTDKMQVEACFSSTILGENIKKAYDIKEKDFCIKRQYDKNGRGKAYFNNRPITISALANTCEEMADFHGQHDHQKLLNPAVHLQMLDKYAGLEKQVSEMRNLCSQAKKIKDKINAVKLSNEEKQNMLDLFTFQLKAIEEVGLKEGEDAYLDEILPKLKHSEKLKTKTYEAYKLLYSGDKSAVELVGRAVRELEEVADLDDNLQESTKETKNILTQIEVVGTSLSEYASNVNLDANKLDETISRQDKISKLKLKYGPEIKDVLVKADYLKTKIDNLQNTDAQEKFLKQDLEKIEKQMLKLANELHEKRMICAKELSKQIETQIKPLGFNQIKFVVSVEMQDNINNITSTGLDSVEFLFSSNPGQSVKPLKNIASGGEMSRVMLGIKTIVSDGSKLMIFDEIDAGIGGGTGKLIGQKLHKTAIGKQVLCVTHLAQVAIYADGHFKVEKQAKENKTFVDFLCLDKEQRTKEIARMLVGEDKKGSVSYQHAEQLIGEVKK